MPQSSLGGPAWSIAVQRGLGILLAGGWSSTRTIDPDLASHGFVTRLTEAGERDPNFGWARSVMVRDIAVEPDGRIVGVGGTVYGGIVLRIAADGSSESEFAGAGQFSISGRNNLATSVVLDPDGRIVVAGTADGHVVVLRLLPGGEPDDSFAQAGQYSNPAPGGAVKIVRTSDGGYRVLAQPTGDGSLCHVLALDSHGAVDPSFGSLGCSDLGLPPPATVAGHAMAVLPDDGLLVGGRADGAAFAVRLTTRGAVDPNFDGTAIRAALSDVAALAIDPAGRTVLAGRGYPDTVGIPVMRTLSNGMPDVRFGQLGTSWADIDDGATATDLEITPDGDILLAGGRFPFGPAFAARILGDERGGGPGTVGVLNASIAAREGSTVHLGVRRAGGSTGAIGVSYRTRALEPGDFAAIENEDYTPVTGELHWDDGDTSDREVAVPIAPDTGTPEAQEDFEFELYDASGGAGLGTHTATVSIGADGAPAGLISVAVNNDWVGEGGSAQVVVSRNYYFTGTVSVLLTPVSGSATADVDFSGDPVTVTWVDGDAKEQVIDIPIRDDTEVEDAEEFTVELSGATGGAVIGPESRVTITIAANDQAPDDPPDEPPGTTGSGGGGAFDWLCCLALYAVYRLRGARKLAVH